MNFFEIAEKYCRWVESPPAGEIEDTFTSMMLLCQLYIQAIQLPLTEPSTQDNGIVSKLSDDDWRKAYTRLRSLPIDIYSAVTDPLAIPNDNPATYYLAFDLADIYRDLKNGLFIYKEADKIEAIWYWRFTFLQYWGKNLLSAARVLHEYLAEKLYSFDYSTIKTFPDQQT